MNPAGKCLNCETLVNSARFCPNCGQKTDTHRLTLGHFLHEVFHAFTHADKGIFYLLKGLLLHPGLVAREYLSGKRKKYFNPFTFFLLLMTVFVISNTFFDPPPKETISVEEQYKNMPEGAEKERAIIMTKRGIQVRSFADKHGNVMAMIAVPFFAFFFWLVYWKKKFNYAEHLTAAVLFVSFANLIFTFIVFPLRGLAPDNLKTLFTFLGLLLQTAYFTWAYNTLMESRTAGQKIGVFFICLSGIILWGLFTTTAFAIYIYQSWDFLNFFKRMGSRG